MLKWITEEDRELVDNKSEQNVRKEANVKKIDRSALSFGGNGTGLYSDFFDELSGESRSGISSENVGGDAEGTCRYTSSVISGQNQEEQNYWLGPEQAVTGQDQSIQY